MSDKRPWKLGPAVPSRSWLSGALVGLAIIAAPAATENAVANGDTRTIYLHHAHTQESISATYLVNGQYDPAVLKQLNWFLRDWRRDEPTHMDARLFDVVWEVYRESGSAQPIQVMSAYRSPETNAMLRRRSRAVAEHSQHILGKAMDQHYVDVPVSRIREIAMRLQRGGVGFYPTAGSPFVHMDVGGVRHWPRMSYDQLARLFPDGKTVHIPSNGQPLPGYEEARAELEARGDSFNYPTAGEVRSKGFFAWLFGGSDEDEDVAAASGGAGRRDQASGRQRVASLDRGYGASLPQASPMGAFQSKDGGARAFMLGAASSAAMPAAAPSAYGAVPPKAPPAPPPVQRPPPPPPPPVVQQPVPDPEAEAKKQLATQMARQPEPVTTASIPVAPVPPTAPTAPLPALAQPFVPMPPRRPVELAADGPSAPLPPQRPIELASLTPGKEARPDPIRGLLAASAPGLPAAITQGAGAPKPPNVLSYAAPAVASAAPGPAAVPMPPSKPPARVAVPLPLPRPNFVAARLDRSNFRSLTGDGAAIRTPARTGLGSSMSALRPAAQLKYSLLADAPSAEAAAGFDQAPSGPAVDRFAGPAVKPHEHVVTSTPASGSRAN